MESCGLMGIKFQFCKMKSYGDCTTMYIYLTLLSISLKMIKMINFCYAYLTTIGKKDIFRTLLFNKDKLCIILLFWRITGIQHMEAFETSCTQKILL